MSNASDALVTSDTQLWLDVVTQSQSFKGAAMWAGCNSTLTATKKCTVVKGHTVDVPDYEVTCERVRKATKFLREWADRLDGALSAKGI